jgi:hypothetical protein
MDNIFKNHFYINLEKREDRKTYIEEELKKLGITQPNRFNAIEHNVGIVGCGLSHIKVVELAKQNKWNWVCIFEDDLKILDEDLLKSRVSDLINEDFDILLLSGNNFKPFRKYDKYLKVYKCFTTGAYIIKKHYYDTYLQNLKEGVELLKKENKPHLYGLDVYSHKIQGRDKWWLIKPIVAIQKEDYSDIENEKVNYEQAMRVYDKKL